MLLKDLIRVSALAIVLVLPFQSAIAIGFGNKNPPEWVEDQLPDTDAVFYGIGSGKTPQEAKKVALEDIAGKLMTQVESSVEINTYAANDKVAEEFSSKIKTSVQNMGLSGYTVDASKKKGKTHWVRLKLDKATLFSSTKAQFDPLMMELSNTFKSFNTKSSLDVKKERADLVTKLAKANSQLFVMSSANKSFSASAYNQQLSAHREAVAKKMNELVIYVQASQDMKELAGKIVHELNQVDWVATTQKPAHSSPKLVLEGSFNDGEQFGNPFTQATVQSKLVDEYGRTVNQQSFNIHGTSRSSHASARQIAVNRFVEEASFSGVDDILGLNN